VIVVVAGMAMPELDIIGVLWAVLAGFAARRFIAQLARPWSRRLRSP
jgi:hypothetical protein